MEEDALRIAVADDDSTERAVVREMLEHLGHEVVADVRTGDQLVDQVAAKKPDVILADLHMPVLDGVQAASQIAQTEETPVVMMTSSHAPQQVQKALEPANVVGYLAKPFGSKTLDGAMRFAVGLFRRFRGMESRLNASQRSQQDRQIIELAKGKLMRREKLNEAEAHRKLQKLASARNTKMVILAREIVEGDQDRVTE